MATSSGSYSKSGNASKGVRVARLQQRSGSGNAFGGYAKVNHGNGSFSMKKCGGAR